MRKRRRLWPRTSTTSPAASAFRTHWVRPRGATRNVRPPTSTMLIGADITRAYAREFKPSSWLATPQASVAAFVVCAETHAEAERLAKSRDLFVARLYTGRGGRYPTVSEAEAHEYTPWERQIVEHARGRRVAGTPLECREHLEALAADYGVEEIVVVTITETAETRRRSYELLAEAFALPRRNA
jgi:alkanesulfonate monooxygenase SsuD/methylene tetrahydromethanopterin reductase-like flavin-dependent oxidoreductase (luciferase family)